MPTLGGIEAVVRIRWTASKSRIVFLSQHNSKALVDAALLPGRTATLPNRMPELISSVRSERYLKARSSGVSSRVKTVWYPTKTLEATQHHEIRCRQGVEPMSQYPVCSSRLTLQSYRIVAPAKAGGFSLRGASNARWQAMN
jgi:hypothetical protein